MFICIIYTCEVLISEGVVPAEIAGTTGTAGGTILHLYYLFVQLLFSVPAEIAGTAGGAGAAGDAHFSVMFHCVCG